LWLAHEAEGTRTKAEAEAQQYEQLRERLEQGADVEHIFAMLDSDGSNNLDFDEFKQVMKFYNLRISKERMLQIFSKYDEDGSLKLNMAEFLMAFETIK
jgi:Ca2+-binding EF-hand superfamily protein